MESILRINNLKKSFGRETIIKDLSFQVGAQEIVGFLGPNGSGKSTTLKCVAGLYQMTAGEIYIGKYSIKKNRKDALSLVGLSIEHPTLYPNLSGLDHLKMMARWRGVGQDRVKEMMDFSGLGNSITKVAGKYSMGMKMRLMLSLSLLHNPKLIILDEPTNGLDPQAIVNLREQIKEIREQGSSILFSSHQLGEVEKIVDRVVLINHGDKLYDGPLPDKLKDGNVYKIQVSDVEKSMKISNEINGLNMTLLEDKDSNWISFHCSDKEALNDYIQILQQNDIRIEDFNKEVTDLESFYNLYYKE